MLTIKSNILLAIICIVGVFLGAKGLIKEVPQAVNKIILGDDFARIEAEVVDYNKIKTTSTYLGHGNTNYTDTYRCTYEYIVDGQTYTGYAIQKNSVRSKGWDRYIFYNKSNPEICYGTSYGEYLHIAGYLV